MASRTFSGNGRSARFGLRSGRVLVLLGLAFGLAVNCTPPDRGIVVDGSLGGAAGEGSGASGSLGGAASGGASFAGAGGDGEASGGTGSGGAPIVCQDSGDCTQALQPICDEDSNDCRACASGPECEAANPNAPLCSVEGACVECVSDGECASAEPVCEAGSCRGCEEHSECESLVCRPDGSCEDPAAVIYALAQTGSYDPACGTQALPCHELGDAIALLSAARPYVVLVPTTELFYYPGAIAFPAGVDATVLGNSVGITSDESPAFTITGGTLHLDGLVMTGSGGADADPDQILVSATDATVYVSGSLFQQTNVAIDATDTELHVTTSEFFQLFNAGVNVWCSVDCAGVGSTSIERSRFELIVRSAFSVWAPDSYMANNLFIEVGTGSYARGLDIRGAGTTVEFNTLIRSGSCAITGLFACNASDLVLRGNISHESTIMAEGGDGTPCYSQVYYSCPNPEYSVSEVTIAGTGNITDDPEFVDYAGGDYRLAGGSPAVDLAPSAATPETDLEGNPRPIGDGMDAGAFERQ